MNTKIILPKWMLRNYIRRWRLELKAGDAEKYKRGKLVEPSKPIVFYIDPATPTQWIPFLIQGIQDWNVAFEAAWFKMQSRQNRRLLNRRIRPGACTMHDIPPFI
jgi:hypothetical protein